jgi:SWI/SNF-related matrix-associated actin-dependent regulator 1 of chromatin subfamily A
MKPISGRVRNAAELRELLHEIMLRRDWDSLEVRAEMEQMPPLVWREEMVDGESIPRTQEALQAEEEIVQAIREGREPVGAVVAQLRRWVGLAKAPAVIEALRDELANEPGKKIVVFGFHRDVLGGLRAALEPFGVSYIDGSTAPGEREAAVERFQTEPDVRVFLGQIVACMESLTLTAAAEVNIIEPLWSPEANVQAASRIRRHGQQSRTLLVRLWSLAGSFDEVVTAILARKAEAIKAVFDE